MDIVVPNGGLKNTLIVLLQLCLSEEYLTFPNAEKHCQNNLIITSSNKTTKNRY